MPQKKPNLVLDLDETLIHSIIGSKENNDYEQKHHFLCSIEAGSNKYYVFFRPGLFEFLNKVYQDFNLYVYTFGTTEYANIVINCINEKMKKNIFQKVYCREDFVFGKKMLFDVNEYDTVIIDDNVNAWTEFQTNIIQIHPFFGPKVNYFEFDDELELMSDRLEIIKNFYNQFNIIYVNVNGNSSLSEKSIIEDIDTDDDDDNVLIDDELYNEITLCQSC